MKKHILILMAAVAIALATTQCFGQLPQGAQTRGTSFKPQYKSPTPGKFPVVGWFCFTADNISRQWFETIKGAGINIALGTPMDTARMARALEVGEEVGLDILVNCPQLRHVNEIPALVRKFRNNKATAGYFLGDEPNASQFGPYVEARNMVYTMDTTKLVFLNMNPIASPGALKTATYREYLEKFVREIDIPVLSYDNYPIMEKDGKLIIRDTFYSNLQQVAQMARETGRPFWAFGLVMAHFYYPEATVADLNFEIFNALAYGAQGIEYYRYMPFNPEGFNTTIAPVTESGQTTVVYDRMKELNARVQNLTSVFLGCKVTHIGHLGEIPKDCDRFEDLPATFSSIKCGKAGILVSRIVNHGRNYLVITNHDVRNSQKIQLKWKGRIFRIKGNDDIEPFRSTKFTLEPGGYLILQY